MTDTNDTPFSWAEDLTGEAWLTAYRALDPDYDWAEDPLLTPAERKAHFNSLDREVEVVGPEEWLQRRNERISLETLLTRAGLPSGLAPEILARAEHGEILSHAEAKRLLDEARIRKEI